MRCASLINTFNHRCASRRLIGGSSELDDLHYPPQPLDYRCMSYPLLPLTLLREVARRYGLTSSGNRDAIIERLRAFDMAHQTTAADIWDVFTEQKLDEFCQALGINVDNAADKAAKTSLLATIPGLAPGVALAALNNRSQTPPPRPAMRIELQLVKQANNERADTFLERARTHFQLVKANDQEAISLLVNAAQPTIATFISQQFAAGITDIEHMLQAVQTRFTPNRYQYYRLYRTYKMHKGQSAQEVGADLKRLYLGFLQLAPTIDLTVHSIILTPTLTAQLLEVLPATTAAALRTELLKDPQISWEATLLLAEQQLQGSFKATSSGDYRAEDKPRLSCTIHGQCGHNDAQCNQQRRGATHASSIRCYQCHQTGHTSRDCPMRNQGNENTGSA